LNTLYGSPKMKNVKALPEMTNFEWWANGSPPYAEIIGYNQ